MVQGAGHVPWWDDPSTVTRALLDFLAETEPGHMTPEAVREAVRANGSAAV